MRDRRRVRLLDAAEVLESWGWARGWSGPDPYDALNGRRVPSLPTPLTRRLAIQLVKRSPIDLRRPLGIDPRLNSATIAHVLSAYSRPGLVADEAVRRERIEWCVRQLRVLRTGFSAEASWGYHFDVETRFFFYSATTPNTIATAFAGLSLLDAHAATGDPDALELAASAGRFVLASIELTEARGGAFFGYFPGDATPIHNASLLACRLLARLSRAGAGDGTRMDEAIKLGVGYALAHQRPDGSWPYAEVPAGDWVDNFHTGYVLDALLDCADALEEPLAGEVRGAWRRGLDLYSSALFDPDGAPRFTMTSRYPIDGQCVAQAIETHARAAAVHAETIEQAWRVFDFGVDRMRRRDGAFYFQRSRRWVNRVPQVRWVQAPMLSALSTLITASSEVEDLP